MNYNKGREKEYICVYACVYVCVNGEKGRKRMKEIE